MQRILFFALPILSVLGGCGQKPGIDSTCEDYGTCDFDEDGWALADGDCNDDDSEVFPGALELWYDGIDQDCSGTSDFDADEDGLSLEEDCDDNNPVVGPELDWYFDGDADGFGEQSSVIWACQAPGNWWVDNGLDCDDADQDSFPGAVEIAGDGVDQDCNGSDLPPNQSPEGGLDRDAIRR
jgi:hypothetical protein